MCPNHPEQFIDWKLVQSVSATERIKLWSRFAAPIDQDTIKAEFFRKVHATNPLFRLKRRQASRERVHIPPMVVHHYRNPVSLLPSLRDVLRCETVFKRRGQTMLDDKSLSELVSADLRAMQAARLKTEDDDVDNIHRDGENSVEVSSDETAMDIDDDDVEIVKQSNANESSTVVDITDKDAEPTATTLTTNPVASSAIPTDPTHLADIDSLDLSVIKQLAFQRLQQICQDNSALVEQYQRQSTNQAILEALQKPTNASETAMKNGRSPNIPLPSQLLTKADIERIAREFSSPSSNRSASVVIDAALGTSPTNAKRPKIESTTPMIPIVDAPLIGFDELRSDAEMARELAARLAQPLRESKVRARAVLMPVDDILAGRRWFTKASMDGLVYMRYRQLSIGVGPGNDVPLRGDVCARVSAKHAVIFYDEVSNWKQ